MPVATVLRYAYVPEVMGVHLSTSQVASRIASWIRPLNVLLHVSEMHLLSIHMCLGFGSQPDMSSWCSGATKGRAIPFSIRFQVIVQTWIVIWV
jgi:hypothetical protein